jgi:hypothetical protein
LVYISRFGILYQEKSGNPGAEKQKKHTVTNLSFAGFALSSKTFPFLHQSERIQNDKK